MGGVLPYKWEGGVLPYKLEVYCGTFSEASRGWGCWNSSELIQVCVGMGHRVWWGHHRQKLTSFYGLRRCQPSQFKPLSWVPLRGLQQRRPNLSCINFRSVPSFDRQGQAWLGASWVLVCAVGKTACEPKSDKKWPRQTKPKKGQFMNFSQGHSGTKVQCESCLFKEKHQDSQKRAKFMNFSFWPFLWFGLPGRLLKSPWRP